MSSYLVVKNTNSDSCSYLCKDTHTSVPYLKVDTGYLDLTTETTTGTYLVVKNSDSTYRPKKVSISTETESYEESTRYYCKSWVSAMYIYGTVTSTNTIKHSHKISGTNSTTYERYDMQVALSSEIINTNSSYIEYISNTYKQTALDITNWVSTQGESQPAANTRFANYSFSGTGSFIITTTGINTKYSETSSIILATNKYPLTETWDYGIEIYGWGNTAMHSLRQFTSSTNYVANNTNTHNFISSNYSCTYAINTGWLFDYSTVTALISYSIDYNHSSFYITQTFFSNSQTSFTGFTGNAVFVNAYTREYRTNNIFPIGQTTWKALHVDYSNTLETSQPIQTISDSIVLSNVDSISGWGSYISSNTIGANRASTIIDTLTRTSSYTTEN